MTSQALPRTDFQPSPGCVWLGAYDDNGRLFDVIECDAGATERWDESSYEVIHPNDPQLRRVLMENQPDMPQCLTGRGDCLLARLHKGQWRLYGGIATWVDVPYGDWLAFANQLRAEANAMLTLADEIGNQR